MKNLPCNNCLPGQVLLHKGLLEWQSMTISTKGFWENTRWHKQLCLSEMITHFNYCFVAKESESSPRRQKHFSVMCAQVSHQLNYNHITKRNDTITSIHRNSLRVRMRSHLFSTKIENSDCSQWPTREVRVRRLHTRDSWFRCSHRTQPQPPCRLRSGNQPGRTQSKEGNKEYTLQNTNQPVRTWLVCKCLKESDTTKSRYFWTQRTQNLRQ